jgi:hypothetical protein
MQLWGRSGFASRAHVSEMDPSSVVEGSISVRTHYRFTESKWHHPPFVAVALHGAADDNGVVVDHYGVGLPITGDIGKVGAACAVVSTVRPVLVWPKLQAVRGADGDGVVIDHYGVGFLVTSKGAAPRPPWPRAPVPPRCASREARALAGQAGSSVRPWPRTSPILRYLAQPRRI